MSASEDLLAVYVGKLRKVRLLSHREVADRARELEAAEILKWEAALSWPESVAAMGVLHDDVEAGRVRVYELLLDVDERKEDYDAIHWRSRVCEILSRAIRTRRQAEKSRAARALQRFRFEPRVLAALTVGLNRSGPVDGDAKRAWDRFSRAERIAHQARGALVESNLRLVMSIAKRYVRPGIDFLDLVQEGNIALLRAIEKFDHRRGTKLSTYATHWIRMSVARYLSERWRTIRLPQAVSDEIRRFFATSNELTQILGRQPSLDEVAHRLGCRRDRLELLLSLTLEPASLDQPVSRDSDLPLGDVFLDPDSLLRRDGMIGPEITAEVKGMLSALSDRDANVLCRRFGIGGRAYSLAEIGDTLGLTRERIRQIEAAALANVRRRLEPTPFGVK